jgi:phosphoribosylglycinamide formyltransferase 1
VRVAVLVSGSGTILGAMLEKHVPVALVLADRPCAALGVAERAGVPAKLLDRRDFGGFGPRFDRFAYTVAVTEALKAADVDLVAMAGFGTVLDQPVHDAFGGRILNTHPALLPAFPGWHAVDAALAAGVRTTGCTVHLATLETDAGPILAQEEVAVADDDTVETLHERIKAVERRLYPETVLRVLGQLAASGSVVAP